jgi:hypothetical protein
LLSATTAGIGGGSNGGIAGAGSIGRYERAYPTVRQRRRGQAGSAQR